MRARIITAGIAVLAAGFATPAGAQVPMSGRFVASTACPATVSIRGGGRADAVVVEAGASYALLGRNATPGTHYLVRVPGASPERRWVAVGCGSPDAGTSSVVTPVVPPAGEAAQSPPTAPLEAMQAAPADFVFAASWHPAFCETRPRAADCLNGGDVAGGFTLHGLWPQPRARAYCGVDRDTVALAERGRWRDLPAPALTDATARDLARVMPGVRSGLDRHEWWKHGTCHGGGADDYFADAVRLTDQLNASGVAKLFESSVGDQLEAGRIRAAFDEAFGRGAGRRVFVDCVNAGGRRMIGELRIGVRGALVPGEALGELILAAPPASLGCRSGEVDAAGIQ